MKFLRQKIVVFIIKKFIYLFNSNKLRHITLFPKLNDKFIITINNMLKLAQNLNIFKK